MKTSCHSNCRSRRTQFLAFVNEGLQMSLPCRFPSAGAAILASLLTLCTALMSAQDSSVYGRTRALDESHSQAERQAEQTVSLSAEKLITLLQKETGLLLEVKKLLVRKALTTSTDIISLPLWLSHPLCTKSILGPTLIVI